MVNESKLIIQRKNLVLELASITTHRADWLYLEVNRYSFNELQELRACLLYGLSFDQSISLVDLIKSVNLRRIDVSVNSVLRACGYGK